MCLFIEIWTVRLHLQWKALKFKFYVTYCVNLCALLQIESLIKTHDWCFFDVDVLPLAIYFNDISVIHVMVQKK